MTKKVSAYSRFVEAPGTTSRSLLWFREQNLAFKEHVYEWGAALYFSALGQLIFNADGTIDGDRSPVVAIHFPRVRRGILWTIGEVRFCPVPLRQFPELERLRRSFLRWFQDYPLIYDNHPSAPHEFDYFLEGSAGNYGPIRAFPSGLAALQSGQYFISQDETDARLDVLCRTLALRGITCGAG